MLAIYKLFFQNSITVDNSNIRKKPIMLHKYLEHN